MSRERVVWLGSHIFPHEAGLRRWLARHPADAGLEIDDVVQETYAILAAMDRVDHIRNPRTYMFEVAKSVVRQSLRRSRVVAIDSFLNADVMQIPESAPSPERIAADRQELRHVSAAIGGLPARCREVFMLRKLQGLSQREVAGRLDIAESTVEKHMIKALALLTNAIGRGGFRADPASSVRDDGETGHSDGTGRCERA